MADAPAHSSEVTAVATRLAGVEVLNDEKTITAIGSVRCAVANFASYGIMGRLGLRRDLSPKRRRNAALAGWLDHYNRRRPHGALSHKVAYTS
jgi:transposase InsO family protein